MLELTEVSSCQIQDRLGESVRSQMCNTRDRRRRRARTNLRGRLTSAALE